MIAALSTQHAVLGSSLLAIHLPDGLITEPWWMGGFVVAAGLAFLGAWRIRDEEIPQVALLTAAFFVATLIHVPVPAGPKAHLVLNGLLGVVLGRRALLAIPIGLFLQAALFGHGGYSTIGINSCIMGLPALLAWLLFTALRRLPWLRQPWFQAGLVALSTLLFALSLVYSVTLLLTNPLRQSETPDTRWANVLMLHPAVLLSAVVLAFLAAWLERRMGHAPEFPLGLLIGETTVLVTVALNCLVLILDGGHKFQLQALLTVVIHLPLAVIEGIVLGVTVGFLVRVKPAMLRWTPPENTECAIDPPP